MGIPPGNSGFRGGKVQGLPKRKKSRLTRRTSKPKGLGLGTLGKGKL